MLGAILAAVGVIIALAWYMFSLGTNSHLRAKAQEHPTSWINLYFTYFDQLMNSTFFRRDGERGIEAITIGPFEVPLVREAGQIETANQADFLSANYAIRILLNPKIKVPHRVWFLWSPPVHFLLAVAIPIFTYLLFSLALSAYFSFDEIVSGLILVTCVSVIWAGYRMLFEKGIFGVIIKLNMNPFMILFVTRKSVFIHSSWMPRTEIPNRDVRFVASDGKFISEIAVIVPQATAPTIIFSFPAYFRQFLMLEGNLSDVADKLNRLIEIARAAPELNIEKPLFITS